MFACVYLRLCVCVCVCVCVCLCLCVRERSYAFLNLWPGFECVCVVAFMASEPPVRPT